MKTLWLGMLGLGLFCAGCVSAEDASGVAFVDVSVVDVENGRVLTEQTVLVRGDRIVALGASNAVRTGPTDRLVNSTGAFLIPGLWDMHVHLIDPDTPGDLDVVLPLLTANGVTGVRDLGSSDLDAILALRDQIRGGLRLGPRIVVAGKLLDGIPMVFPPDAIALRTPAEARKTVEFLADQGVDTIKVYEMLQPAVFVAIVEVARKLGLPIAAHPPLSMHAGDVSDYGVKSFEHFRNIELACSSDAEALLRERSPMLLEAAAKAAAQEDVRAYEWSGGYGNGAIIREAIHQQQQPRALASYDEVRCSALLGKFARNGTWQTPTLFMMERGYMLPERRSTLMRTAKYVPQSYREAWDGVVRELTALSTDDKVREAAQVQWYVALVQRMREAGVGLLAGTDVSNPWLVPGYSLHEELWSLVRAGLTPTEALQTATLNPARFLGEEATMGTIEVGKIADLVLLKGNPLDAIENTARITAVVRDGRYLNRDDLDQLLDDAELAARKRSTP
jgi:hypothetical protein